MSDGTNRPWAEREDQKATLIGARNHAWRVRGILLQTENQEVRLDGGQVEDDPSARGKPFGNYALQRLVRE